MKTRFKETKRKDTTASFGLPLLVLGNSSVENLNVEGNSEIIFILFFLIVSVLSA